jgi:hypothetical protein
LPVDNPILNKSASCCHTLFSHFPRSTSFADPLAPISPVDECLCYPKADQVLRRRSQIAFRHRLYQLSINLDASTRAPATRRRCSLRYPAALHAIIIACSHKSADPNAIGEGRWSETKEEIEEGSANLYSGETSRQLLFAMLTAANNTFLLNGQDSDR